MKQANAFKQNSKDWYKWRDSGLGASDAPIVMAVSPWTTRFELWAYKTALLPKPEANPFALAAMKRGTDMEPEARAWYEKKTGYKVETNMNCEHEQYPFIRASLDGFVLDGKRNVEIKCPGKEDLAKAKKGKIPEKYMPQVQTQMLVAKAEITDYVTYAGKGTGYFDGEDGLILTVAPDKAYQALLEAELVAFWKLVESRTPPSIGPDDFTKLATNLLKESERAFKTAQALDILAKSLQANKEHGLASWKNQLALSK